MMRTTLPALQSMQPNARAFTNAARLASLCLACIVALAGCESTPYPTSRPQTTAPVTLSAAERLQQQAELAQEPDASPLWLRTAQQWLREDRAAEASAALDRVQPDTLSEPLRFDYGELAITLALRGYDAPRAQALFSALLPTTPAQDQRYRALATELAELNIDPAAAASALINAPAAPDATAQQARSDQIWALISQTDGSTITQQLTQTSGNERGWWQLKQEMLNAFTLNDATGRLTRWQTSNALHPASQYPPSELRTLQSNRQQFDHIALLVPQSGPLAAAGKAVRDGFFAAHLHADDSQRVFSVYDSASGSLPELLSAASDAGADLIVGPLDKNRVAALNAQLTTADEQLPTLLLNYLPQGASPRGGLVQFGLAVEDEAIAIARRIQAEGLRRVVVLHNEKDWSVRAKNALLAAFDRSAQNPLAALPDAEGVTEQATAQAVGVGVTPDVKQLTAVVGATLRVNASQNRHRRLERVLGEDLEFVARARKDVDAIVAFLDTAEARALRPALRFHFASDVPVYTSSQALRRISSRDLRDLRGFNVSEIPWKLYPSPIKATVEDSFSKAPGSMASLYALGVDAYRLADRLDLLLTQPHQRLLGGTGELSIEQGGRVRRDLAWQYVSENGLMALPFVVTQ